MKKRLFSLLIILSLILLFANPPLSISAAKTGLSLWALVVVPTLLPAIILTSILVKSHLAEKVSGYFSFLICPIFKVSPNGSFCVLTGLLCGYPLGSRTVNDMLRNDSISEEEAKRLLAFTSFPSPMFIISFIHQTELKCPSFIPPFFLSIISASILIAQITFFQTKRKKHIKKPDAKPHPVTLDFKTIDTCITESAGLIIKIGIIIMMFSIAVRLIQSLAFLPELIQCILCMILEMTVGIHAVADSSLCFHLRWILCGACAAFGGLSTLIQTRLVLTDQRLSPFYYLKWRLVHAFLTACLLALISYML